MYTQFRKALSTACLGIAILGLPGCLDFKGSDSPAEDECSLCHTSPVADDANHNVSSGTAYDLGCNYCHEGYSVTTPSFNDRDHLNDRNDVVFDTLALSAQFGSGSGITYAAGSCSNIPCHGYGREDIDNITWHVNAALGDTLGCRDCHDHFTHRGGRDCDKCHPGVTPNGNDVTILDHTLHINGIVELSDLFQ
jgi:predicted CxxxxCH...CXXCH cytochrome family protein